MRIFFILIYFVFPFITSAQLISTKFEDTKGLQTPTYPEIISWWKMLDAKSSQIKMLTMGPSDAGYPLHLVVVSNDSGLEPATLRKKNKRIILINNGIHPGEPDGIDASMLLVRDIVQKKILLPDNIALAIIPVYNIGGCLNRSAYYRVNQNGPEEFGFRGNSQNLDLNRDFIKCDSKEARSFAEIFHFCDPDVFVDNHVSNGADYQHIMTLISSQHNKLGGPMGEFMNKKFEPGIFESMKKKGYDLIPYVNSFTDTPENGWPEFLEGPRFSSGYASLFHSFAFVPETHMLKPYDQRVKATYDLMESFIEFTSKNSEAIRKVRDQTKLSVKQQSIFPVSWILDKNTFSEIVYKGYEVVNKQSEVSGLPRLYYDRTKPFEQKVKFYNTYQSKTTVNKPVAYIIPKGWWKVIDLLKLNKVKMLPLVKDTSIEVETYRIEDYKTSARTFEMHHINSDVLISSNTTKIFFQKGDVYVPMDQTANRFIIEVLEPQADDSYFAWNYFDGILGQKEGFSNYAYEETAAEYLKENPGIKNKLEQRKLTDTAFSKSASAQLNFIFQQSPYYEPSHMRYPVYRVMK
ncbi:MAG: M14 family metallopeptidase [Chitinophagaceae bacterium]|nr:M14 family metallopeptidase [Chitinophagaceae bacterium]